MSRWQIVSLGSLASFRNGLNYTKSARERGGLPIVGVKDFQDRVTLETTGLEELDSSQIDCGDTLLEPGDILFVRSNGNRELIGRSMFVADKPPRPTTYSGFSIRLRVHSTEACPRFLAYLFRGPVIRSTLSSQGGGTNISNLNQGILANLKVPLPPLPIQRRIASILGAYDDLIEVNRRRIAVLEEMARRLFDEWFVHFRFPGHEGHRMVETEHGRLPEGWSWKPFGDLCHDIRDTVTPSMVEAATPYVGLEHIPRRSTTLNACGRADEVSSLKHRFQFGDVLFGKIRPYFHKVAWAHFDGVCSSDAIVIRAREQELAGIVLAIASSDRFVATSVQTSNGTKMPRANWSVLVRYLVPMPEPRECIRVSDALIAWANLAAALHTANTRLAASRDLLLPRLISGELSITTAERELEAAA